MKLTVKADDFAAFRNGECVPALNKESVQTEYVKVLNSGSVTAWPDCVAPSNTIMFVGIGVSVAVIVIGCAIAAYLLLSNTPKKLLEEEEVTSDIKEVTEEEHAEKS